MTKLNLDIDYYIKVHVHIIETIVFMTLAGLLPRRHFCHRGSFVQFFVLVYIFLFFLSFSKGFQAVFDDAI